MGLDNGLIVKSNKRKITRAMLPEGIQYPFSGDYNSSAEPEIIYHRKDWGWRTEIMNSFGWRCKEPEEWKFNIETPNDVLALIALTAKWLDKDRWLDEGDSIWDYEEDGVAQHLIIDICNLALIYGFMLNNPDVYLEFYDSY